MRRKSERSTANKKPKASPEKKVEKTKRTRTRRRKQSVSSENESADEAASVVEVESVDSNSEVKVSPSKEVAVEETQDQVWQVKTAEGTVGEIQKLKICLTRPPSTPEMVDSSPLSKRKHSRTTSSSDTPSTEGVDERKKKKHSKRLNRELKDEPDKSQDSQDELDIENKKLVTDVSETSDTDKGNKVSTDDSQVTESDESKLHDHSQPMPEKDVDLDQVSDTTTTIIENECDNKPDADSTVVSPQVQCHQNDLEIDKSDSSSRCYNESDKNEVLNSEDVMKQIGNIQKQEEENREVGNDQGNVESNKEEVSSVDKKENRSLEEANIKEDNKASETNVVDSSQSEEKGSRKTSTDTVMEKEEHRNEVGRELDRSNSVQSTQEECLPNGGGPIVINRKRRWGSRPSKITTHKSITISTDILKEIIPDVKPVELDEVIEEKKQHRRVEVIEKVDRPVLPKIVIDNTDHIEHKREHEESKDKENVKSREAHLGVNRKISIVKENDSIITRPPSPPRHKPSCILYITNLVRPFTLPQLKNLLQRTGRLVEDGFWIDRIKSKCFVKFETEDQAVETRHALHGVTWPVSNPKSLQVDFSTQEAFDKAKLNEDQDNAQASTIPGTVEDWLREQDLKRERGDLEKKTIVREWDVGKNGKEKEKEKFKRDEHPMEKRRHRTPERSPEPARKFKKKEEEAPAKLLDDLFRKTKSVPCIYWLPLSAETIAIKEEQRRKHMAEHERRMQELRRTHRRH